MIFKAFFSAAPDRGPGWSGKKNRANTSLQKARWIADGSTGLLTGPDGFSTPAVFGKNGLIAAEDKVESDMTSPIGVWPLRQLLYRADRLEKPTTALTTQPLTEQAGWCDAVDDPNYNRYVTHPYPASAEKLWRDDCAYDLLVVLGHNDDPVVPNKGSAIFLHLTRPDRDFTAGCVAIDLDPMRALLAVARPDDCLAIIKDSA